MGAIVALLMPSVWRWRPATTMLKIDKQCSKKSFRANEAVTIRSFSAHDRAPPPLHRRDHPNVPTCVVIGLSIGLVL